MCDQNPKKQPGTKNLEPESQRWDGKKMTLDYSREGLEDSKILIKVNSMKGPHKGISKSLI